MRVFIWSTIINKKKKKDNQFVALNVDSVAPRHTMVYVWETLPYFEAVARGEASNVTPYVISPMWILLEAELRWGRSRGTRHTPRCLDAKRNITTEQLTLMVNGSDGQMKLLWSIEPVEPNVSKMGSLLEASVTVTSAGEVRGCIGFNVSLLWKLFDAQTHKPKYLIAWSFHE